jgi:hypothetical protein
MPKKLTQNEFIKKSNIIHNFEYDYSEVKYNNSRTPINIICKTHGRFSQKPDAHLNGGCGCPKCYGNEFINTEIFIEQAIAIHGNKYDYSRVEYKDAHSEVEIICPKEAHGSFWLSPNKHKSSKTGCTYCADKLTTEIFKIKGAAKHNNFFDYSKVDFKHCSLPVKIICPKHGEYYQRPVHHLFGKGCFSCAVAKRRITIDEFLDRVYDIHQGKYDYSLVDFRNFSNGRNFKVKIKCEYHGVFEQNVSCHLDGHGCSLCNTWVSKGETNWLNLLSVPIEYRQQAIFSDRRYKVDAYDPTTNTIYEYYGDYWHGNPNVFPPDKINTRTSKNYTMAELYARTMAREELFKSEGYNLITIWEHDFKQQQLDNEKTNPPNSQL